MEAASSAGAALVGMIRQAVVEELRQIRGVGDKIVNLRDELATMNALLRMLAEADDGSVDHLVREWTKQVRELAYDAEDFVDDFQLRVGRTAVPPGDGAGLLSRARHLARRGKLKLASLRLRRDLAASIVALHARAITVSERRTRYGIERAALRASSALAPASGASASAQALRPVVNDPGHRFVGIEDQVAALADRVRAVRSKERDMKLKTFSIVGFGGLGKTTLAMEVCRRLEPDFDRQANVSVSQAFDGGRDLTGLLQQILQQLLRAHANGFEEEESVSCGSDATLDQLTDMLKDRLTGKRYLVVIDDVWTIAAWTAIWCRLPDTGCGSRIVVTTRSETVAKSCSPASVWEETIYHMKPLQPEHAKQLFMDRVFGDSRCPEQLEPAMKSIIDKCGGLPLAIVSLGSLLASYTSASGGDMWERVCKSVGSQMESSPTLERLRQMVTLSYNHLPHHLRGCMMYLAAFPEDCAIDKARLLYRWIAEGLVAERRGLTLLEVAEAQFEELLDRSLVQPAGVEYGGSVGACRVHDVMLEVMVSKALEANFLTLVGGQGRGASYDKIRRLSIHGDSSRQEAERAAAQEPRRRSRHGVEAMNLGHVRSLSLFRPDGRHEKLLLERLLQFPLLRVLDLEDCKAVGDRHMGAICRLFLLKFLSLKGTDIATVPDAIAGLEHLQMFNLDDTLLAGLPDAVTTLEKLECLRVSSRRKWDDGWTLPRGLGRMRSLGVLNKVLLGRADAAREIGELLQLRELSVILTSDSALDELAGALGRTHSLRWLQIVDHGGAQKLNFLLKLSSPPLLLRFLRISGFIDKLPEWITSLTHLTHINMSATKLGIDHVLGVLCNLPSLMEITLWRESYVDDALVARAKHPFQTLKKLSVVSDRDEHRVLEFERESMKALETLEYRFDDWHKRIVGVEHLRRLKEVTLFGNMHSNPSLLKTVEELKAENNRRQEQGGKQFKLTVKKD